MQKMILSAAGIILLLAAGLTALATGRFVRTASLAAGVVERLNAGGSHPQIRFSTAAGQTVSYPQGGLIFGYHPGDRVRVRYLPTDPGKAACLDVFGALWFAPMLLAVLGILFILFSRVGDKDSSRP